MKSLMSIVAVMLAVAMLVPSSALAQSRDTVIRIPEDEYASQEKPRPEQDLKKEAEQLEEALKKFSAGQDFKKAGRTYLNLGRVYEGLRQFDKVGKCYEKALGLFQKIGDTAGEAQDLSNLGWLKWKFGQYDEAMELYKKTLEASKKMGAVKGEAWALYAVGHLYQDWGQKDQALESYEKALKMFVKADDTGGEAMTAFKLGWLNGSMSYEFHAREDERRKKELQHKKLAFYEKALEASRKIGDTRLEAQTLDMLGRHYLFEKGTENKAETFLSQALTLRTRIGDAAGEAQSMNILASMYAKHRPDDKALKLHEKVLQEAQKLGNAHREGQALKALGYIHQLRGQSDKATQLYEQALATYIRIGNHIGEAQAMSNIALIYLKLGQPDKALLPYEKALATARNTLDAKSEARALTNLGYMYHEQARYAKAEDCYQKALVIFANTGNTSGEAQTLYRLGELHRAHRLQARKQYDKDLEFFSKAVEKPGKIKDPELEAKALTWLGFRYTLNRKYDDALKFYQKALAILTEVGDTVGEAEARRGLAEAYQRLRKDGEALARQEKVVETAKKTGTAKEEAQAQGQRMLLQADQSWETATPADVLATYQKAVAAFETANFKKGIGNVYRRMGTYFNTQLGQYDKAEEYLSKAWLVAREAKDSELEKTLLLSFLALGDQQKIVSQSKMRAYKKILEIAQGLKERTWEEAYALLASGWCHQRMGQYGKALEYMNKALTFSKKFNFKKQEQDALDGLTGLHLDLGEYNTARDFADQSLVVARELRDRQPDREAQAFNSLGLIYKAQGQHKKAIESYEKSLDAFRKLGDVVEGTGQANALNNLGEVHKSWGQYNNALERYEQALYIYRKNDKTASEAVGLQNLGEVYQSWGQYDKAIGLYDTTLTIRKKLGDNKGEAATLMIMGQVLERRGDHAEALKNYKQGLTVYSKAGLPTSWPKDLIGNLYLETGDISKAEPLLKEAGNGSSLGRLSLAKSEFDKARKSYEEVLKAAEKDKNVDNLFTAYTGLGLSCEGMKDDKASADYFRKAVQLVEDLRSRVTPENRERFLDVKVNGFYRTTPYEGLARVLIRLNKTSEAWKSSEYTKARLFAEAMSARARNEGFDVSKDVLQLDEDLNNELAALKRNRQTAYEKDDKEALASLDPKVKAMEEKFQKHVKMMRDKYPVFAASKYPEPMDLPQTALKADEWVLSYDVGDPGLIIYLTKGKALKKAMFKPIPRKDLDALVRKVREPLDIKPGERTDEKIAKFDFTSGKKLADILLAEILTELPKDAPLIIIPADCLGVLPFEMLVLNEGGKVGRDRKLPYTTGAEFLGDRNPVSYYQSVTALTLARNFAKQKGSEAKRLVMSDPIFDLQDQRLKNLEAQKKENLIKALPQQLMAVKQENKLEFLRLPATGDLGKALKEMDPTHTELCMGMEASKPALFKKPLDKYASLVFATHGYFGKELAAIQEPVLVLTQVDQPKGQDGFLRLSEVMGLKLNADIVALTACQTGLGRRISGEGTMGMGRAFQYAGAKSVLMSLWNVSESASVKLVESFFRNLKAGESKLESLKLARDEIRKNGFDHPFYWAPFILVGQVQ